MGSTRITGILATIVACLTAIVAAIALYTSVLISNAERDARTALRDATAYAQSLDGLRDAVLDAETGQRGYLLTGDRDYLAPYDRAIDLLETEEGEGWSHSALKNDADGSLRNLVELKLSELQQTMALFDSGSAQAALSVMQTDRGREIMADIRTLVRERQSEAASVAEIASDRARLYNERSSFVSALLALLLGLAAMTGMFALYQWLRARRAESEAEEAVGTAVRIEVIAHELDHRMKNMFAIAQGMLRQSARGRGDDVVAYSDEAVSRLQAMSHAYSATRELDDARSLPKSEIIDRVVRAQLLDNHNFAVVGEDTNVAEKAVSPLALILHEWTTNALKYGAWRPDRPLDGTSDVRVSWKTREDGKYELLWDERHGTREQSQPVGSGYGTKLIKACAAQLGGSVDYEWHDKGVRIRLIADAARLGFLPRVLSSA